MRFRIVIAAHNEGASLVKTVESSVQSVGTAESDYEVIVADDASWDGSIEETKERFPQVRGVRNEKRRGTSPAKHRGAQAAQGDVLIFLDGHCQPRAGALLRLVEDVEQLEGEAVVTPAVPSLDAARWENSVWQIGHGYHLSLETFDCGWLPLEELKPVPGRRKFYESPALNGCAVAMSRALYNDMRGFDADMLVWGVEDLDFGLRCWMLGHPILHDPEAVVGHRFRSTFDNYEVPYERLLVNQLRMARKVFTHSVWQEWVERCQRRHANRRSEHPEGLWARAWHFFQEHLASADAERMQVQGRRVRDEFEYAERFGVGWPKLRPTNLSSQFVRLESDEPAAQPRPVPSPPPDGIQVIKSGDIIARALISPSDTIVDFDKQIIVPSGQKQGPYLFGVRRIQSNVKGELTGMGVTDFTKVLRIGVTPPEPFPTGADDVFAKKYMNYYWNVPQPGTNPDLFLVSRPYAITFDFLGDLASKDFVFNISEKAQVYYGDPPDRYHPDPQWGNPVEKDDQYPKDFEPMPPTNDNVGTPNSIFSFGYLKKNPPLIRRDVFTDAPGFPGLLGNTGDTGVGPNRLSGYMWAHIVQTFKLNEKGGNVKRQFTFTLDLIRRPDRDKPADQVIFDGTLKEVK